ncbi:TAXI family TRAP transporter solute-binding subunit [Oscillochloris sp. ZM17-4]|uniref:TAXI family TRAP transporter solute-binding subunit n=1 Tax=Oscillochloris sp. ZM17-4 TaxID=2866714 RepID=UPI001C73275D|nr:TAXI family TRAP transporter solute-binding subunit [Oscillochloris sp. ZM17-4]
MVSRIRLLALMLIAIISVSACGAAAPAAAPTTAPAAPAAAEPTAAPEAPAASSGETLRYAFGGGPVGGVFQVYADVLSLVINDGVSNVDITAEGTGGSAENLRSVNAGDRQFGIVYSGDVSLGSQGVLPEDATKYDSVMPVAPLYGGVAHLVVSVKSGVNTVADLEGKRVALGNAGSGAALSAERYFKALGLYDKMQVEFLGYSQAAAAMGDGQLDGFWVLAGFPNSSVTEASTFTDIKLLDIYTPGVEGGFFKEYPFYSQRALTGGAYPGNDADVQSFQDTALWVANKDVPADVVYNALKAVYIDGGLARLLEAHPSAKEMGLDVGVTGIANKLHPGAVKFWEEQGVSIPAELK